VNQQVFFTAEASRAAAGRQLVSWDWNFGSGRTGSGESIRQTFGAVGTYNVTLTVTDDAGNRATATQSVNVSQVGTLQAVLRVSPTTGGTTATTFQFDGAESTPGSSPIVEYRFNFGDNTPDVVTTIPVTSHKFTAPGSYQVSLQVKDSLGRTSVARITVGVALPASGVLLARITASKTTAAINEDVVFDASASTAGLTPIASYAFDFADGTPVVPGSDSKATHKFASAGTRIVKVTIKDKDGLESSASVQVVIQ
jgi:PKD repeat protein